MAYTSHGHLIPGTRPDIDPSTKPRPVYRCGGPKICSVCAVCGKGDARPGAVGHPLLLEAAITRGVISSGRGFRLTWWVTWMRRRCSRRCRHRSRGAGSDWWRCHAGTRVSQWPRAGRQWPRR